MFSCVQAVAPLSQTSCCSADPSKSAACSACWKPSSSGVLLCFRFPSPKLDSRLLLADLSQFNLSFLLSFSFSFFLQNYSLLSYIHLLAKFSVSLPLVLQVQPLCRVLLAESKINYILQIVIYLSVCLLFEHWSIILVKLLYVSLRPLSQLELFLLAVSVSTGCGMLCWDLLPPALHHQASPGG